MTSFSQAWSARQGELDPVFAENHWTRPMRAGGYAAGVPDRTAQLGNYRNHYGSTTAHARGREFRRPRFRSRCRHGQYDRQHRCCKAWDRLPNVGDLVMAVDRPDAPSFEIAAVESDGLARVLLSLVRMP